MIAFLANGVPCINILTETAGTNYFFNTLSVPTNQWVYCGASIDLANTNATFYVVTAAGTATSETQLLGSNHGGMAGSILNVGDGQLGSSIADLKGNMRQLLLMNTVATANNHRYWHGIAQAALGATDWAGTETSPGTAEFDFNAADGHAGSNDAAWLADWSPTGSSPRGSAVAATVDSRNALVVTGTGSASVDLPAIGKGDQLTFGTKIAITNKTSGYDQVFLTIGDKEHAVLVLSRDSSPTLVEVYSPDTGQYQTLGSYRTNEWIPLTVSISSGQLNISYALGTNAVVPIFEEQPIVYFGQAYLNQRTLWPTDAFTVDVDSTWHHVAPSSLQYIAGPSLTLVAPVIAAIQPTITFIDVNAAVTNYLSLSSTDILFANTNSPYPADAGMVVAAATGNLTLQGSAPRETILSTSSTPIFIGTAAGGTLSEPTAISSGRALAAFYGSGYSATNVATSARAGMVLESTEAWSSTANGAKAYIQVTPNLSTNRATVWTWDQDGTVNFDDDAPRITATASNGASGFRLNVLGATTALLRIQTNSATTHTFSGDGSATFTGGLTLTRLTTSSTIELGNASDTTLARSAAGVVTIEGVKIATQPTTETLTYSTTNVTITAGKGPMQRSLLTVTNNFQLLWSGLTDNDGGVVHLIPATTNVTVLVSSPGRAAGSTAATATGSTTLTITGATNGWAELAWSVVSVGGTNRVSVNLGAY
jgi:hypothetical protein